MTNKLIGLSYSGVQRVNSSNPYDMVDYYNVIMNNPMIDDQIEKKLNMTVSKNFQLKFLNMHYL